MAERAKYITVTQYIEVICSTLGNVNSSELQSVSHVVSESRLVRRRCYLSQPISFPAVAPSFLIRVTVMGSHMCGLTTDTTKGVLTAAASHSFSEQMADQYLKLELCKAHTLCTVSALFLPICIE